MDAGRSVQSPSCGDAWPIEANAATDTPLIYVNERLFTTRRARGGCTSWLDPLCWALVPCPSAGSQTVVSLNAVLIGENIKGNQRKVSKMYALSIIHTGFGLIASYKVTPLTLPDRHDSMASQEGTHQSGAWISPHPILSFLTSDDPVLSELANRRGKFCTQAGVPLLFDSEGSGLVCSRELVEENRSLIGSGSRKRNALLGVVRYENSLESPLRSCLVNLFPLVWPFARGPVGSIRTPSDSSSFVTRPSDRAPALRSVLWSHYYFWFHGGFAGLVMNVLALCVLGPRALPRCPLLARLARLVTVLIIRSFRLLSTMSAPLCHNFAICRSWLTRLLQKVLTLIAGLLVVSTVLHFSSTLAGLRGHRRYVPCFLVGSNVASGSVPDNFLRSGDRVLPPPNRVDRQSRDPRLQVPYYPKH
ncbi:hypothetical protein R1flu_000693 [Riccia fluitans]|uniref:Uncharacterized protein n=1 Tax=Riccia fluitans TaxID=41844 RepID=A0ABD1Y152_9MARC